MELEAAAGEVAVDDPVGVGDVGSVSRRTVLREVVVVRMQLPEHRQRTWARQAPSQRPGLLQGDLHVLAPPPRQHAREMYGTGDFRTVRLRRGPAQPARRHRVLYRRQRLPLAGHGRSPRGSTRHDQQDCDGEQQPGETPKTHHAG